MNVGGGDMSTKHLREILWVRSWRENGTDQVTGGGL